MPDPKTQEARLIRLKAYEALPSDLRNAVRAHLIHGVPLIDALSIVGRRNPTRDAAQERLQAAIAAFKGDGLALSVDDLVQQMETVQKAPILAEWAKRAVEAPIIAPGSPQSDQQPSIEAVDGPHTSEALNRQIEAELPDPEGRCPKCGLVLCGCSRGVVASTAPNAPPQLANIFHADELFKGITAENLGHWRQQEQAEHAERRRLINEFEHDERMRKSRTW